MKSPEHRIWLPGSRILFSEGDAAHEERDKEEENNLVEVKKGRKRNEEKRTAKWSRAHQPDGIYKVSVIERSLVQPLTRPSRVPSMSGERASRSTRELAWPGSRS